MYADNSINLLHSYIQQGNTIIDLDYNSCNNNYTGLRGWELAYSRCRKGADW